MARGNEIIVTADPKGQFEEGIVKAGITLFPGMAVQRDLTIALIGGRFTFKIYDADVDGGRPKGALYIVTNLIGTMVGRTTTTQVPAGEREMFYSPRGGEEINILLLNLAGTADDHTIGEVVIPQDATGKFIATAGSPEIEPFQLNETITDPTADTLTWATYTGY